MPPDLGNEYCCCQVFFIYHGIYLIALHCFLQAAYAVGVFLTSYHKEKNDVLIYFATGSHLCLIPVGILALWANLYENWRGARVSGFIMALIALCNSIMAGIYFFWFANFKANSQLDRVFFWNDYDDWISSNELPFTFWHILSFQLVVFDLIWFYYSVVLCHLGSILKAMGENKKRGSII